MLQRRGCANFPPVTLNILLFTSFVGKQAPEPVPTFACVYRAWWCLRGHSSVIRLPDWVEGMRHYMLEKHLLSCQP